MDRDLAELQELMGWSDDTLLTLLRWFISSRRLERACMDYLYELAGEEGGREEPP
jgi:hypothetical protein